MVALARVLADQVDASEGAPGTRLVASYLTALRAVVPHEAKPPPKPHGRLQQLRAIPRPTRGDDT